MVAQNAPVFKGGRDSRSPRIVGAIHESPAGDLSISANPVGDDTHIVLFFYKESLDS